MHSKLYREEKKKELSAWSVERDRMAKAVKLQKRLSNKHALRLNFETTKASQPPPRDDGLSDDSSGQEDSPGVDSYPMLQAQSAPTSATIVHQALPVHSETV